MSDLIRQILHSAHSRRAVILIDGGSGSGKTSLARQLVTCLKPKPQFHELQLVSLDDIYPGWHGLAEAALAVVRDILRPDQPGYRRWDWASGAPANWVPLDETAPILIEGCGSLTPQSAALATSTIWLDLDAAQRKNRTINRDGKIFLPYWEIWAAQESEHWRSDRPRDLAEIIITQNDYPADAHPKNS